MVISEAAVILGASTAVLAILFGARLAARALADGGQASATVGTGQPDVAGVIALPPFIFLGSLVTATVLEVVVPLPVLAAHAIARYLAGVALTACGFVMIGMGMRRLVTAGTNIPPSLPTTALVVDGIYKRTRNPLYLGTTLVYVGLAVAAGSLWAIMLMVPLLWVINVGVIAREESYLERKFGMRIGRTRRGCGGGFDGALCGCLMQMSVGPFYRDGKKIDETNCLLWAMISKIAPRGGIRF